MTAAGGSPVRLNLKWVTTDGHRRGYSVQRQIVRSWSEGVGGMRVTHRAALLGAVVAAI